jgi:hypothetical protein
MGLETNPVPQLNMRSKDCDVISNAVSAKPLVGAV